MSLKKEIADLASRISSSHQNFAIDLSGPAGAGKGTIGKELEELLDAHFFSTGNIYRFASYFLLNFENFSSERILSMEPEQLNQEMEAHWHHLSQIEFNYQTQSVEFTHAQYGTQIVSFAHLRLDPQVSAVVSTVAGSQFMREQAGEIYRQTVLTQWRVIGDGRDGDRVLSPEALAETAAQLGQSAIPYVLLIYIFADEEVLIKRALWRELEKQGCLIAENITDREFEELADRFLSAVVKQSIHDNIIHRNQNDHNKPDYAKLLTPVEAIESGRYSLIVDSSHLTVDEVILLILQKLVAGFQVECRLT